MNTLIPKSLTSILLGAAALLGAALLAPSGADAQVSVRPVGVVRVTSTSSSTATTATPRVRAVTAVAPSSGSTSSAGVTAVSSPTMVSASLRSEALHSRVGRYTFLPASVTAGHRPAPNTAYTVPVHR